MKKQLERSTSATMLPLCCYVHDCILQVVFYKQKNVLIVAVTCALEIFVDGLHEKCKIYLFSNLPDYVWYVETNTRIRSYCTVHSNNFGEMYPFIHYNSHFIFSPLSLSLSRARPRSNVMELRLMVVGSEQTIPLPSDPIIPHLGYTWARPLAGQCEQWFVAQLSARFLGCR